jgi:hypothetical protein
VPPRKAITQHCLFNDKQRRQLLPAAYFLKKQKEVKDGLY